MIKIHDPMKWNVEFCQCGFGRGDVTVEYDTREECLAGIASMEEHTDSTVQTVVSPSGARWERASLGDVEVPER